MIVAYVPNLMDRSKIAAAAPDVVFVADPESLAEAAVGARLVVLDLSRPGALASVPALAAGGGRVVGFASHVNHDLLQGARSAGCAVVLARSAFFGRLGPLLGGPEVGGPEAT